MDGAFQDDIARVAAISAVPRILDALARLTGMRFAAVARVTESRWIACAVRDDIDFGLAPGGELDLGTTLCDEVRGAGSAIAFPDAHANPRYRDHHTPRIYGLRGYLAVPIRRTDGSFFGTLCAIDPEAQSFVAEDAIATAQLFADLIGAQLSIEQEANLARAALESALAAAFTRQARIAAMSMEVGDALQAATFHAYNLRGSTGLSDDARAEIAALQEQIFRVGKLMESLGDRSGRLGRVSTQTVVAADVLAGALRVAMSSTTAAHPERGVAIDIGIDHAIDCDLVPLCEACASIVRVALEAGGTARPIEIQARSDEATFRFSASFAGATTGGESVSLFAAETVAAQHGGTLQRTDGAGRAVLALTIPCRPG